MSVELPMSVAITKFCPQTSRIPIPFEILIGLRENHIKYTDFTSTIDNNKHSESDFNIQGNQWFFGGGLSF